METNEKSKHPEKKPPVTFFSGIYCFRYFPSIQLPEPVHISTSGIYTFEKHFLSFFVAVVVSIFEEK